MTDNDQAAVEALCAIAIPDYGAAVDGGTAARAILNAIRKGAVPGVIFDHGAVAALMRAAARLENGIAETERADKATAERDQLRAEVERLRDALDDERSQHRKDVKTLTEGQNLTDRMRREAIADGERRMREGDEALAKLRAEVERLRSELTPAGWDVLEQSGCPRCGDDVVAEPAMDGDGFLDGNPARCQSCGLPGQVTVDDDGAHFTADDRQWGIDAEAKRADKAAAERDRLAGLLDEAWPYLAENLQGRISAALAEIGGGK